MVLAKRETSVERRRDEATVQRPRGAFIAPLLLGVPSFIAIIAAIWLIFFYAPTDAIQGDAQRIFYIHVPSAWIGMLAFVIVALGGIVYLIKADERWDLLARASAEIGAVFLTIALTTGSLWGKPIWGTWWTWEPQLTATLILWFMFIGYLMLRNYMGRTHASARAAAVLAIVGVIDVPIIYEAANWWRTLHPAKEVGVPGALPPAVVLTLLVALVAFTLLYSLLMILVYRLQRMQTLAQRLRAGLE
ncbi:MAG: cytochrome c biogenesis protein CcsA [Ktedonobacteraceae bacterium]|nr:cytochrome c biogenesis protein CcsA [Ktedonobacteraceae bacterium]